MTPEEFRELALSRLDAIEGAHQGHADFRIRNKIFATLGAPDAGWGMVKLNPEQQQQFVQAFPDVFVPCPGSWGKVGCTYVRLQHLKTSTAIAALELARSNVTHSR